MRRYISSEEFDLMDEDQLDFLDEEYQYDQWMMEQSIIQEEKQWNYKDYSN